MDEWAQMLVTVLVAFVASTGFWSCIQKKMDKKDASKEMLIGLAHDRIQTLGMEYIERKWVSNDEYENLNTYLYAPYRKLGGNGTAERIMSEVNKLEIRRSSILTYEVAVSEKTENQKI